jgi:Xaa-Pro aminopeptidase
MFDRKTYQARRQFLHHTLKSGIIFLPGNVFSPMNYRANPFPFRQDSTFRYYFGLNEPDVYGLIDLDAGVDFLFADEVSLEDQIWMGSPETKKAAAGRVGITKVRPVADLEPTLQQAIKAGRRVHFPPQYRPENLLQFERLLGLKADFVNAHASIDLIKAVVQQRAVKTADEVAEIERALQISFEMYDLALLILGEAQYEYQIAGALEGVALQANSRLSFPLICSVRGEVLHNHAHHNRLKKGDLLLIDSGIETDSGYASDITRTFPVSGTFDPVQKRVYETVLKAQETAIAMIKPGVLYRDIHLAAALVIAEGMKDLGLMKGNMEKAVKAGAHALFFPHGLGHLLGMDVHDMENLGEQYIGYDEKISRSDQFGLAYLRFARKLQAGFVITVEPGVYFIPQLIDTWQKEKKHAEFINYAALAKFRGFGGIRIEDDVLVTARGHRVLGPRIPKTPDEIARYFESAP